MGVLSATAIVNICDNNVPVRLMNVNNEKIYLNKDSPFEVLFGKVPCVVPWKISSARDRVERRQKI